MRHALDHPAQLPGLGALALGQRAGVHQDVFAQGVGIARGERHWDAGGEGHLVAGGTVRGSEQQSSKVIIDKKMVGLLGHAPRRVINLHMTTL